MHLVGVIDACREGGLIRLNRAGDHLLDAGVARRRRNTRGTTGE
jgi:hypothetical protein